MNLRRTVSMAVLQHPNITNENENDSQRAGRDEEYEQVGGKRESRIFLRGETYMTTNPATSLFASSSPTSPSTVSPSTTTGRPGLTSSSILTSGLVSSEELLAEDMVVVAEAGTRTSARSALSKRDSCAGRVGSTFTSWVSEMEREAPMGRAEEGAMYSGRGYEPTGTAARNVGQLDETREERERGCDQRRDAKLTFPHPINRQLLKPDHRRVRTELRSP